MGLWRHSQYSLGLGLSGTDGTELNVDQWVVGNDWTKKQWVVGHGVVEVVEGTVWEFEVYVCLMCHESVCHLSEERVKYSLATINYENVERNDRFDFSFGKVEETYAKSSCNNQI